MHPLRQELQNDLDRIYPSSVIDTEHTVGGKVQIRFELGGDRKNGSKKRVKQATERAYMIFNEAFPDPLRKIWILINEYDDKIFGDNNAYLHELLAQHSSSFYDQKEQVNSRYTIEDEYGNDVQEKQNARIIIGRLPVKDMNAEHVLAGIANLEMGFRPCVPQIVKFIDPLTASGFQMYDERGCYVWSDSADKIRNIYEKYKDWIPAYHRPEIDEDFN